LGWKFIILLSRKELIIQNLYENNQIPRDVVMASYLEESLQRGIDLIRTKVIEMGNLEERALQGSLQALVERNRQLAYSVILRDQYIDELEKELDRLCLEFLVRQQPVGLPLRFVYAAIKINNELERIGDYAESIARHSLRINALEPQPSYAKFVEIANMAIPMLRNAIQAFIDQNADLARATMELEEKVDNIRNSIHSDVVHLREEGKLPLEMLAPLLIISSRFERVADQACNICEEVLYMCTGEYIKHKGGEAFRMLFVDDSNACTSQMAEGIAAHSPSLASCLAAPDFAAPHRSSHRAFYGGQRHRYFAADFQISEPNSQSRSLSSHRRAQQGGGSGFSAGADQNREHRMGSARSLQGRRFRRRDSCGV
jgi:phosphate transport system protein